jgi:hypothetical protein
MIRIIIIALVALAGAAAVASWASAQTPPERQAAQNAREYREATAGMPRIQIQCAVGRADTGEPVVLCPNGPVEYMPDSVIDAAYQAVGMARPAETIVQPVGTFVPKNWPVEEMAPKPRSRSEDGGGPYLRDYGRCKKFGTRTICQ